MYSLLYYVLGIAFCVLAFLLLMVALGNKVAISLTWWAGWFFVWFGFFFWWFLCVGFKVLNWIVAFFYEFICAAFLFVLGGKKKDDADGHKNKSSSSTHRKRRHHKRRHHKSRTRVSDDSTHSRDEADDDVSATAIVGNVSSGRMRGKTAPQHQQQQPPVPQQNIAAASANVNTAPQGRTQAGHTLVSNASGQRLQTVVADTTTPMVVDAKRN